MAKKKNSWFNLVKRLFIWDTHSTQEKKEKRRKWIFGRLNTKKLASIRAPPKLKETEQNETEEEKIKDSQVGVMVNDVLESVYEYEDKCEESQGVETRKDCFQSIYKCQMEIKEFSAIKIQTAFRGYLARKALKALRGIVKLQALIRGRAVRRQAMKTLKSLQSIVSIQSKTCARRLLMVEGRWDCVEHEDMYDSKDKIIRMDSNSERKWDESTLLKKEVDASCIIKKEAIIKRERIKEYTINHRRSAESERSKVNGRWRYWLEQWVDTQLTKSKELEDLDSVFTLNSRTGEDFGSRKLKLRTITQNKNRNPLEGLDSPIQISRKYFPHMRKCSIEDQSISSSPATPAYMAATESAKAKARSTSSPKARSWNYDMNSDSYLSPCKKKLSIVSSVNSEVLNSYGRMGKFSGSNQQRSPSFKGVSVPIKSSRTIKDLSINSDCSVPYWDRQSSFK